MARLTLPPEEELHDVEVGVGPVGQEEDRVAATRAEVREALVGRGAGS